MGVLGSRALRWRALRHSGLGILLLIGALLVPVFAAAGFLPPDEAFRFAAKADGPGRLELTWTVAPGYHLYRDRIRVTLAPSSLHLQKIDLPRGKELDDPAFGKVRVLEGRNRVIVHYTSTGPLPRSAQVSSTFQGCANAGVCYPEQHKTIDVDLAKVAAATADSAVSSTASPAEVAATPQSNAGVLASGLQDRFWLTLGLFFLSGLGLAFTPCVFPMIPILSALIVGQKSHPGRARAFVLSLAYVLGMALTYTLAGVLAALTGAYFQAFFQSPWVLAIFAGIFVLLALSMFGFYELQMPSSIQSRLSTVGRGGHLVGSFVMGALSALIVGPCVAAPLAGGLLFISQTGNVLLGALSLFVLSLGMGIPLLIIGTSAGHLLPRAGPWMDATKAVFGVLMLGVAIWLLARILPGDISLLLWSALAVVSAVYLRALEPLPREARGWQYLRKGIGILLLAYGLVAGLGGLTGHSDPLAPMGRPTSNATPATPDARASTDTVHFTVVKSPEALANALAAAKGKPVLIDYWAQWCIECTRMDKVTFADPKVRQALAGDALIRVDVTADNAASKALLQRFRLVGPPAFVRLDARGQVVKVQEGYLGPDAFLRWLDS